MEVVIAIGSNIGSTVQNITRSLSLIGSTLSGNIISLSSFYLSKPRTLPDQQETLENFTNAVALIEFYQNPFELLKGLKFLEKQMGRQETVRWGSRVIDLDIIYYGDLILKTNILTIPHAETHLRDFVLEPLQEIAPYKKHPLLYKFSCELLRNLPNRYVASRIQ